MEVAADEGLGQRRRPLALALVLVLPEASTGPLGCSQQKVEGALLVLEGVFPKQARNHPNNPHNAKMGKV